MLFGGGLGALGILIVLTLGFLKVFAFNVACEVALEDISFLATFPRALVFIGFNMVIGALGFLRVFVLSVAVEAACSREVFLAKRADILFDICCGFCLRRLLAFT
jgi:hypothetical protein